MVNLKTREEKQLTDGASETVNWGVAEFVAQEEMDRFTGYWWAPGDRYLAVAGWTIALSISSHGRRLARQELILTISATRLRALPTPPSLSTF